ncbi:hypothetical protein D3C74_220300 [compost metagenome]
MGLIDKILSRHVLYCPKCGEELYFYMTSSNREVFLKCIKCSSFYKRNDKGRDLIESNAPKMVDQMYFDKDEFYVHYHGIPTSIAYKPKWLFWIERLIGKG